MNLISLLHNEKTVKSLEAISKELEDIKDAEGIKMVSPKTILLIEFILNRAGILERSDIMFDLLKFIILRKKDGNK
jgi:hypothetical protein